MKYYDRYWNDLLPKDIPFFSEKPIWDEEKLAQHTAWVDTWALGKMLDYGCGSGKFTAHINAIGTDISDVAIEKARAIYPDTVFLKMGELSGDGRFDTVFFFDVLEHVFDFDEVFSLLELVLEKKGRLLITTNENCFIKMVAIGLFWMDNFFHYASPHIRFFTAKHLKKMLDDYGYRVIHKERVGNYFGILSKGQFVVAEKI
jgi:SAM-dependent methyltransferase